MNHPAVAEHPTLRHSTALARQTLQLPDPRNPYRDLQKGEIPPYLRKTPFPLLSSTKQGNVSTAPRQTPSKAFREAQTLGFVYKWAARGSAEEKGREGADAGQFPAAPAPG